MSSLEPGISQKMMTILKKEEKKTDLDNLAVLSRVGMKVASASSAELDADATSASTTALIDLGLRLSEATAHGALKEIILHNNSGYSILMAINDEYIVFSGLKKMFRIGYYLGYLRELAKKLKILISGDEITEMALSLEESELEKIRVQQQKEEEKAQAPLIPSVEQDKEALGELLGFLDDWEGEGTEIGSIETSSASNIVSIPKSASIGIPKESKDFEFHKEELLNLDEQLELDAEIGLPTSSDVEVYPDEVPPGSLDDYTPLSVEDEISQDTDNYGYIPSKPKRDKSVYEYETYKEKEVEEAPPKDLPSFDELSIPDFDSISESEYDTDFVLEEESEALDSVLKDLGWGEED